MYSVQVKSIGILQAAFLDCTYYYLIFRVKGLSHHTLQLHFLIFRVKGLSRHTLQLHFLIFRVKGLSRHTLRSTNETPSI